VHSEDRKRIPKDSKYSFCIKLVAGANAKLILMKITRLEQQQQHQMQLLQRILEALQPTTADADDLPEGVIMPVKSITALKELDRKLSDDSIYCRLVFYIIIMYRNTFLPSVL